MRQDGPSRAVPRGHDDTRLCTPFAIATTDRGDVVSLVASSGAAFATYSYGAWGNPTGAATRAVTGVPAALADAIAARQPLRYAGYVFDPESGYYYCSARMYDPVTRQFTSKDRRRPRRGERVPVLRGRPGGEGRSERPSVQVHSGH